MAWLMIQLRWPPRVTVGRLLPHVRGLGFEPHREGFPSGAKKEWGLSPKTKGLESSSNGLKNSVVNKDGVANVNVTSSTGVDSVMDGHENLHDENAGNGIDVAIPVESIRVISERFVNMAYGFFLRNRVAYPVVVKYFRNTWGTFHVGTGSVNKSENGGNSDVNEYGNEIIWASLDGHQGTGVDSVMAGHENLHDENVGNGIDVAVPVESIRAISERFVNMAYGFFLRNRVAYPVVVKYFRNTWGKYGLVKSMLNSSIGLFLFQFSSMDGLDSRLENWLWFIHNNPLNLKKWKPDVNLLKEDVVNVPFWVKLHGVPMTAFSEDGLSAIATKLGTPLMLDSYTSDILSQEFRLGFGEKIKNPSQAPRGVLIGPKVGFKQVKEVYRHVSKKNYVNTSGNKKKDVESRKELEILIIGGKFTLVDDEGKPLKVVDYPGDHDSEGEVAPVDNEMTSFLASKRIDYDTNSLMEQWRETYENADYDYDPYDDDVYEGQEIPNNMQSVCDNLDIKLRGRKKK
ncbi:hypothetical protein Tco_1125389 [Tanacetum coccineum]|uniref:DUF4283 domain-containing protein n=1 Tax=Tanacetum coccineum TaxID=301880 RepID=A0ABQ5J9E0_9ASTR